MSGPKAPKAPKVGDVVEIVWVDSGMDVSGRSPSSPEVSLDVATTRGKVVRFGVDVELAKQVPKGFPCVVIVVEMCSSAPTLGAILWRDVVAIRPMRSPPKKKRA